jgi:UDP-glucuronate 4-epimerase
LDVLITGVAGFIGAALARTLLEQGHSVTGIDNLNDYYDVSLKDSRLKFLQEFEQFEFSKIDIADRGLIRRLFEQTEFQSVVNLAAQAGVRYSIENPSAYVDSNLVGFGNILEGCRHTKVKQLIYASSSSVYGANRKLPFSEADRVDHPISLYAATKKANELMAYAYSHLYGLDTVGLRFFTVYGPWGRPDMALFKFTKGILNNEPIPVYNEGDMIRDFTYIDDVVEGVVRIIMAQPSTRHDPAHEGEIKGATLAKVYNIGCSRAVQLMEYIRALESALGKKAKLDLMPMQDGDVPATEADVSALQADFDYRPRTTINEGIARFVEWYRSYYDE